MDEVALDTKSLGEAAESIKGDTAPEQTIGAGRPVEQEAVQEQGLEADRAPEPENAVNANMTAEQQAQADAAQAPDAASTAKPEPDKAVSLDPTLSASALTAGEPKAMDESLAPNESEKMAGKNGFAASAHEPEHAFAPHTETVAEQNLRGAAAGGDVGGISDNIDALAQDPKKLEQALEKNPELRGNINQATADLSRDVAAAPATSAAAEQTEEELQNIEAKLANATSNGMPVAGAAAGKESALEGPVAKGADLGSKLPAAQPAQFKSADVSITGARTLGMGSIPNAGQGTGAVLARR